MAKMRNSPTDLGALAQWIGRKIVNHNPLEELSREDRAEAPNIYKSSQPGVAFIDSRDPSGATIYCTGLDVSGRGRVFRVTVAEVPETPPTSARVPVGK